MIKKAKKAVSRKRDYKNKRLDTNNVDPLTLIKEIQTLYDSLTEQEKETANIDLEKEYDYHESSGLYFNWVVEEPEEKWEARAIDYWNENQAKIKYDKEKKEELDKIEYERLKKKFENR